ncbi:MAG: MFS transporter [Candidatus Hydrogenedentota bacterium]
MKKNRRLALRTRTGYGAVELGMSAAEVMLLFYLLEFYTKYVGLRADLAGFALALALLWDAITDPLMGGISDRTRSRFGKRRPYIFLGMIVLAAGIMLVFSHPDFTSQSGKFFFLLFGYIVTNTGMTIIAVPHAALAGEISFDRNERTELFGWRMVFRTFGLLVAALLPGLLVMYFQERVGMSRTLTSRWVGIAVIVTGLITFFSMAKIDAPAEPLKRKVRALEGTVLAELHGFFRGLRAVATNKAFLPLLLTYVIAYGGRTLNTSVALYYYEIRLELSDREIHVNIIGLFTVVVCLSIGAWVLLSRKYGKKLPGFWGAFSLGVTTIIIYPIMPPGQVMWPMLLGSVLGGFLAGSIIIFESLVADVVDYDELITGEHREGLYFGCWTMTTKVSRAVTLAFTGLVLDRIGLKEGQQVQPDEVGEWLAIIYGPVVGGCFLVAALIFLTMPLTDARHRRIQVLLTRRRAHKRRMAEKGAL